MKAPQIAKLAAVICALFSITMIIAYVLDRDRPLGEGYKLAKDYGGEFTMQSDQGEISLSDFKGKVIVAYFGFMNCVDACPVSLTKMRAALKRLSDEELQQVQGVLVSIDPERDNPADLGAFVRNYHSNVIGLTSSRENTDKVLKQYGVFAKPEDLNGESSTYTVDHSSRFYMIDKQGQLLTTMSHSTTPAELVAKIRTML